MKKELTKDKQWLKISAICIAVYLLIAIPLTIWIDCITWHWFWFGFFVVYIPLAFFYMYFWSEKRIKPNEEQKKTATLNICKYILLFWFYDLLYMAIFNQWMVLEYIFGIIAVIIIFSNLIKAFLSGIKAFKWMLPFDLLCGVGLSVYLIYRMPNETLQTIVLTIVAALYGGLLTLVGVAWTIKKTDEDRKEEDKKKYKPIVNFVGISNGEIRGKFFTERDFCESENNPFLKNSEEKISYNLFNLLGRNTDFSQFYMCGIIINKTRYYTLSKRYVDRDEYFGICSGVCLYLDEGITYLSLILQDLLGNEYKLPIKFEVQEEGKTINIKDMGFVCDINTEECNEQF